MSGPLGGVKLHGAIDGPGMKATHAGFTFMISVLTKNVKSRLLYFLNTVEAFQY
jgi:hypothetical protein